MEDTKERLKKYRTARSRADELIAAKDTLLPTADLIEMSKEIILQQREDHEAPCDFLPLMILHLRSNHDTFTKALALLPSNSSIDRELGCRILREFPGLDAHPTIFSERIIEAMSQLLETEKNEDVFLAAISTIGWQGHDKGHDILLRLSSDSRAEVRYVVAGNLLKIFGDSRKVTEETAKVFLTFAQDPDEDIRWSVFYDMAEFPDIFSDFKEECIAAALHAKNDSVLEVRNEATRAFDAF